ncbi:hypothetical protein GJ496_003505, partial [Pomphorhynchus laevis]
DFLDTICTLNNGSVKDKLAWIFNLYDIQGHQILQMEDIANLLIVIDELYGVEENLSTLINHERIRSHLMYLCEEFNIPSNGYITRANFIETLSQKCDLSYYLITHTLE